MSANNPQEARRYLKENKYELTKGNDEAGCNNPVLTYRKNSGNGSWEGTLEEPGVAAQNSWVRKESGGCCIPQEKSHPKSNYCGVCGTGVNGNVTWEKTNAYDASGLHTSTAKPLNRLKNRLEGIEQTIRICKRKDGEWN